MIKKRDKILFILFVILGSIMFGDAVVMFLEKDFYSTFKDIALGIGFGCIGFLFLLPNKKDK